MQERETLTDNVSNSYIQASGMYPEVDFSQLYLGKTVVDGRLVDE